MKLTTRVLCTYTADISGICSALYELGGMTVIHDASGCNSTYTTHDEPRWYKMDSMVYISALTEIEAVMGDDEKLICDITDAAKDLKPAFIAIGGTPIPMMMGTDFKGIGKIIEKRTGIPTFGFSTNGMHSYIDGIAVALEAVAERFCPSSCVAADRKAGQHPSINLLGLTPLDFSITGNSEKMVNLFEENGFHVNSSWAMGNTLKDLSMAGKAHVNVVVSASGLLAAKKLKEKYGTPFVVGLPIGKKSVRKLFSLIEECANTGKDLYLQGEGQNINADANQVLIIGEQVFASSLRCCLIEDLGMENVTTLCPLNPDKSLMGVNTLSIFEEEDMEKKVLEAKTIIADPIYRRLLPTDESITFIDMPHEAYSGRIYRDDMKVFIGDSIFDILRGNVSCKPPCKNKKERRK
jgi:nitrogenase molybdenum-iron protein alpha/beta subunit